MATVQSQVNGFDSVLEDLPAWKKELILRRRANAKFHGEAAIHSGGKVAAPQSPNSVSPPQHILSCLGQGQSQLSVCSVQGAKSSVRTVRVLKGNKANDVSHQSSSQSSSVRKCLHHRGNCDCVIPKDYDSVNEVKSSDLVSNSMRGPTTMHHKGFRTPMDKIKNEGLCNNDDEEFEYGPGIVSRLKNRYLSLALREAKGRASLRKYSSLEDLLDDGIQERGRSAEKERPLPGGNKHKDSMKRARSMDSLSFRRNDYGDKVPKSHSSGALRNALEKKDVIIIENIRPKDNTNGTSSASKGFESTSKKLHHQSSLLEEEELPAPDTVKQVKQIFESSGRVSKGTAAAKAASYKAAHSQKYPSIYPKPPIKAKPTQIQCKTISPTIENAKSSLKQVQPVIRSSPRSVLSVKATPPVLKSKISSPLSPKISGLTPITCSVTSPQVNGEKSPLIHSEKNIKSNEPPTPSPSVSLRQEMYSRPHSPPPSLLPLSPTPTLKASTSENDKSENDEETSKETERVLQENRKNKEKSSIPLSEPRSPSPPPKSFKPPSPVKLFPDKVTENIDDCGDKVPTETFVVKEEVFEHKEISAKPINVEKKESLNNSINSNNSTSVPSSAEKSLPTNPSTSSSSVMEVIRAAEAKSSSPAPSGISPLGLRTTATTTKSKKDNRHSPNENCPLVFNFSKRAETPDYIENDGVDLSKRQFKYKHEPGYVIMPGYDGKLDSSTDGDDDGMDDSLDSSLRNGAPPPPCNISFEGEGVIINGRSNLQRQPRTKKLEVSFDMPSTSTFEYPSENLLVEEFDLSEIPGMESSVAGVSSSQSSIASPSPGGLASYTPSKLKINESFELGVSRSTAPHPPTPPKGRESLEEELSHVRPADESQTVTWSSENAPDMLF